jgi:Transcriptional regulator, AbiEi antitoxin
MRDQVATDHLIAALADRQHGYVAHGQLLELGLSSSGIGRRVHAGRLHRRYRGVYTVGHRRTGIEGEWWAVVLAFAPDGVLSHVSAGAAWEILRSSALHVTVSRNGRARRPGVVVHHRRSAPDEVTELNGLPITTPARTLLDLAASGLNRTRLEVAVDRAERTRLLDFADLHRLLARHAGAPGTPSLKAVWPRTRTRSMSAASSRRWSSSSATRTVCRGRSWTASLRERCAISAGRREGWWSRRTRTRGTVRRRRSTPIVSVMWS